MEDHGRDIGFGLPTDIVQRVDNNGAPTFVIKDSGKRQGYDSGMVRDTQEGKADIDRVFDGPLVDRLAAHLTKGAVKYPDDSNGVPNWTLANSEEEMVRFRKSAARHFRQWRRGDTDEDHFAAVVFNMNCYEYVKARLLEKAREHKALSGEPDVLVGLNQRA